MSETDLISILSEYLWAGIWISAPMLITALVVGVAIGLVQALTSVQELTLTFVPKLVAILIAFSLTAGYASRVMVGVFESRIIPFIAGQ